MKRIVRTGVFETNSSSSHSLSLAREDQEFVMDSIYPDQNGVIRVDGKEFGWGWDKFNDAITKLAYAFQDSFDHEDLIREVVMKQTGATEVIFEEGGGYIDHDGVGTTQDLRGDREDMRNFIFNKNSWLYIGNDNSEPDPMFFNVPEFKDGRQILPEYKFELVIDGLDVTTKYLSEPDDEELSDGIESILDNAYLTENGSFIIENSIYFQIGRPRNTYYEKGYSLEQDYSTREIRFLKENDPRWSDLVREMGADPEIKKLNYHEKGKIQTERAMAIKGLVQVVKFNINKL
jgi:hypothetical protein